MATAMARAGGDRAALTPDGRLAALAHQPLLLGEHRAPGRGLGIEPRLGLGQLPPPQEQAAVVALLRPMFGMGQEPGVHMEGLDVGGQDIGQHIGPGGEGGIVLPAHGREIDVLQLG
jgi:hypothetical protein